MLTSNRVRILVSTAAALIVMLGGRAESAEVLFIGGQPDAAQGDDVFVLEHLEELGHNVEYLPANESETGDADGKDLLVLSSTFGSGDARGKFQDSEVPILQWEEALVRWDHGEADGNFRMTEFSRNGQGRETSIINIVNPDHPLACGFPAGELEIFDDINRTPQQFGEPAPGLIIIAELDPEFIEEDEWVLTAIDKGGELGPPGDGFFAPDKRVNFPIEDLGFSLLNENGLALFNCSVDWLLGAAVVGDPGDFNGNGELDLEDVNSLIGQINVPAPAAEFDLNGDGMVDGDDLNTWVLDLRGTWIGDANLDGEFNSGDFVAAFTAGKYESGEAAGWHEGDWNADGLFSSSDFVTAFSGGGYEMGPRMAVSAVPEPATITLIGLASMMLLTLRRR